MIGTVKISPGQIGASEVGADQQSAGKIGPGQVLPGQIGVAQVSAPALGMWPQAATVDHLRLFSNNDGQRQKQDKNGKTPPHSKLLMDAGASHVRWTR